MDIIGQLVDFLSQLSSDPVSYTIIFFIYCVLAAIILPFPVEIGLFFAPGVSIIIKALILGAGKATGSVVVFYIGERIESPVRRWSIRWHWFKWLVEKMEWLVAKLRYIGLYLILSIPLMSDSIPLYLFALFNKEGKTLNVRWFAVTNFLAGVTRALIVYTVFDLLGIKLI